MDERGRAHTGNPPRIGPARVPRVCAPVDHSRGASCIADSFPAMISLPVSPSSTAESKTLNDVDLPWKADLPLADHGKQLQNISLNAQTPITGGIPTRISCRILVDDKTLTEKQDFGFAGCLGNLPR